MSASTMKGSMTEPLARNRPSLISGTTASMAMRWSMTERISDSDRRRAAVANPPARQGLRALSSMARSLDVHWRVRRLGLFDAAPVEVGEEPAVPPVDILPDDIAQKCPVAGASFLESHLQTPFYGSGNITGVIRVYEQRVLELFRRTREMRQDQHARILGVLGGDIFLGDEVHAVAQRRDQPDPREAADGG